MKQLLLFVLFIFLSISVRAQIQGPPPPCGILENIDICADNQEGEVVLNLRELFPFSQFCLATLETVVEEDYHPISYYLTEDDMTNEVNVIQNPESYINTQSNQIFYFRANKKVFQGYTTDILTRDRGIEIFLPPFVNQPSSVEVCDDNEDGFATFDLLSQTNAILTTDDGVQNWQLNYYESLEDANNVINDIIDYRNYVSDSKILFVRLLKSDGCVYITSFNLIVQDCSTKGVIEINAFYDANSNEFFDTSEISFLNGTLTYEKNNDGVQHSLYSSNGVFNIISDNDTNTYDISYDVNNEYDSCYNITTTSYDNISVTNESKVNYDFPINKVQDCGDIALYLTSNASPRPGFYYYNRLVIVNNGLETVTSGSIEFTHDPTVTFKNVSGLDIGNLVTNTATGFRLDFVNLQPNQREYVDVIMNVPVPTSLGTVLTNTVTYSVADLNVENNVSTLSETVIGSYDPNDITESHGPEIYYDDFTTNDYLYYTIRFQNVGTADAINVSIDNTLDAKLDKSTIQMLNASHDYVFTRTDNQLNWQFDNIHLPSEDMDEPASHGYVYYKIKPLVGYKVWDIIPNTAEIYFDFNSAVITNTFETKFIEILSNKPSDISLCDDDSDGVMSFDLTLQNTEILGSKNPDNFSVSYYLTLNDAENNTNQLPTNYNASGVTTIYVRTEENITGSYDTTSFEINVLSAPSINQPTPLEVCDSDVTPDGYTVMDLTEKDDEITGGDSNLNVTYHYNSTDAGTGNNPIPTPYINANTPTEIVYVRVINSQTGCVSTTTLKVIIHTMGIIDIGDFALCDTNNDVNDTLGFNLNTIENYIANDLSFPISVTFFQTEVDRDSNTNEISKTNLYEATSPEVLYISIENTSTGCSQVDDITLLINQVLFFNSTDPIVYCDTDNDGIVSIDLHALDNLITSNNNSFEVTYFNTISDAENNTNQLAPFYSNTNPIETLVARITSVDTGCHTENLFDIEVLVAPAANKPTPIIICDNDQDGFSVINLEDKIPEVNSDTTGLNIDFYTSYDDANADVNPIFNTKNFISDSKTFYIRVENALSNTQCYNIVELEVIVNTLPIIPVVSDIKVCQEGGSSTADFLLADKDAEILNGQTGKEVYYFEDAALTIPIDKNNIYQNTSSNQTIYVKVENITDKTCFDTSLFNILVSSNPIFSKPSPFLVCDDISNDEFESFDLNEKTTEINQSANETLNITYYSSRTDAENNTGALPTTYTNTSNPQTIYIRIESADSFCFVIEELSLNIIAAPNITQVTTPLIECDTDYDGMTTFNLEDADFQILDRIQTNLIINYFENFEDINQDDGLDNTNEILDPKVFFSESKTVYIKVANTLTGCFSIIPLELVVNNIPPSIILDSFYELCEGSTLVLDAIISDSNVYTYSWSNSENTPTLSVNKEGVYTVTITNTNGCTYSATAVVTSIECGDDDSDGIINSDEDINGNGNLEDDDTDKDGIPDYKDDDDDGDNIDTADELIDQSSITGKVSKNSKTARTFIDTDSDTIENYLDDDDDGDGVLTKDEDYNNNGTPLDDDTNANNVPDYLDKAVALGVNVFDVSSFSITPNPANNLVTLSFGKVNANNISVNIYNIQGKQILKASKTLQNKSVTLDVSHLKSGLYFLKVSIDDSEVVKKLIKE
ncbi:T9SS type A sorting domain-containing protein [Thalassobellus citreus]|uniref:T9SS type A sorting domain-containing protein n=1 Tax=Thalassobellus citreus TaxID=3367752 RepID=UPI00378EBE3A